MADLGYTIVNWAPVCGAKFDVARMRREHDVLMEPYTCTKEAGHEGMHWDEPAEALCAQVRSAQIDGKTCPECGLMWPCHAFECPARIDGSACDHDRYVSGNERRCYNCTEVEDNGRR